MKDLKIGKNKEKETWYLDFKLEIKDKCVDFETNKTLKDVFIFSASGYSKKRNSWIQGGQCLDSLKKDIMKGGFVFENGIDKKDVLRIIEIWEQYHLNDMKAGTRKQMEFIESKKIDGSDWYERSCGVLKRKKILVDNGYTFGSGWLCEQIPSNVVDEIQMLEDKFDEVKMMIPIKR